MRTGNGTGLQANAARECVGCTQRLCPVTVTSLLVFCFLCDCLEEERMGENERTPRRPALAEQQDIAGVRYDRGKSPVPSQT